MATTNAEVADGVLGDMMKRALGMEPDELAKAVAGNNPVVSLGEPIAEASDYHALFTTPLGKRVLSDMTARFVVDGVFQPGIDPTGAVWDAATKAVVKDVIFRIATGANDDD